MSTTRDALDLHAAGRTTDALILLFNALGAPNRAFPAAEEKQLLAQLLEGVALNSGNEVIHRVLLDLLQDATIDAQQIARAVLGLLESTPEFAALERWSSLPEAQVNEQQLAPALQTFCAAPLVRALLPRVVISSLRTERVCTLARRVLLALHTGETPTEPWHWDAVRLVGQSAFNGEYAWRELDDEREFVNAAHAYLASWLTTAASDGTYGETPAPMLLLYALYRRLTHLPSWELLAHIPEEHWHPFGQWIEPIITTHVHERLDEQQRVNAMPSLDAGSPASTTDTSARVRAMYEAHPYPRWSTVGTPRVTTMSALVTELTGRAAPPESLRLLIAGCGTGRQTAHTARSFPSSQLLALDLSHASLGFAARQTQALGINNVEFMHGDILALDALPEQFAMIFCSGVLHHLQEPRAGWRQLTKRLHPQGIMKIALYSETARQAVTVARRLLEEERRSGTDHDVRRAREKLLALPATHAARPVTDSTDFFSLSGCRDLVMHVQECTYTIPALAEELDALQLRFLGFQLPVHIQQAFRREHPAAGAAQHLEAWAQFEQRHPATFWGMYQFFVAMR
jgi:SAM-dependent methyltransferase